MSHEVQVQKLTDIMAQFVGFTAKKLPDDVIAKLEELRAQEDSPMATVFTIRCSAIRSCNQAGSPIVPGYRRFTVLGKMRNKISID